MSRTLIHKLTEQGKYPVLTADSIDETLKSLPSALVFISGNPKDYPEANDVAVILSELTKQFAGRFQTCVIDESFEKAFAQKTGVVQFPALVFYKFGQYVDQISRMQDWSEYVKSIPIILEKSPSYAPSIGIPVVAK